MAGLLPRGVTSESSASTSNTSLMSSYTPSSFSSSSSSISEDSLEVPTALFVSGIKVDAKAVKGTGSYGSVYVAQWHGSKVAAKRLHEIFFEALVTPESKMGILRSFAREVNMLVQLKHPNIVQFYGVYKSSGTRTLELSSDTYLIQELMHCALDVRNRQSPRLTLRHVVDIGKDIASGLRYLHERAQPILHRDLASKNVLLSTSGVAKIADLGVAKILEQGRKTPQSRLPGTELYMPPEVKIEGMPYDTLVDIYSVGVIFLEMSIGRDSRANEAFRVGSDRSIVLTPEIERRSADFEALGNHPLKPVILKCLSRREERPTARAISLLLSTLSNSKEYQSAPETPIIPAPSSTPDATSPKNNYSLRELSSRCEMLEGTVQALQRDKNVLQNKLDSYLRGDHEEQFTSKVDEDQIDKLMSENASLQSLLIRKDAMIAELSGHRSLPFSLPSEQTRDQRANLLQKLNEAQESKKQEVDRLQQQVLTMYKENSTVRQELQILRERLMPQTQTGIAPPESEYSYGTTSTAPTSLPEQLPSYSSFSSDGEFLESFRSKISLSAEQLPTLKEISTRSSSFSGPRSVASGAADSVAPSFSEFKKVKKQLDKYKSVNIELDQRLKEAQLELQKYSGRRSNTDVMYQNDIGRMRAENSRLQARLNSTLHENNQLRSQLGSRRY